MRSHEYSVLASQIQELAHKKMPEEVCSSWTVDQTKSSRLILLLHCTAIAGYNTLVIATRNKCPTTGKQENRYRAQFGKGEGKPPQTKSRGSSGVLTLCILFYARAMV